MSAAVEVAGVVLIQFQDFAHCIPGANARSVARWSKQGGFPAGVRLGGPRAPLYFNAAEVERWIVARMAPVAGAAQ